VTICFELAQKLKRNPREIAEEVINYLKDIPFIERVEIAGGGYINFFIQKDRFFLNQLRNLQEISLEPEQRKIVVEHTNINPNKAAHIGHLRNACLGDTLVRCLRYKGEKVEVQNYIDDTGVQVGDVVFGFLELEKKSLEDIKKIDGKFDYYCWDLYTKVTKYFEENPEAQEKRAYILKRIEEGKNPEAEIAEHISNRIVKAHLNTMRRIGVTYDLLPRESDILRLKFWEKAFNFLKEKKAIQFVTEGVNKGCWVMRFEDEPEKEKIIVRSNGTVTYVGKDIAYQLWKFGLLGRDFYYKIFEKNNGQLIWMTTSKNGENKNIEFGKASKVYNVIDVRQSYLQKIVAQSLKLLGYEEEAKNSIHFSYEMVALSKKCLEEFGLKISPEEKKKSFLEISGRKGLGIKADDLLDKLEEKALNEVEKRNPQLDPDLKTSIAQKIMTGALRYFMLKYARNSIIVFDFDEALNFEGETGPYLQYSLVRANSIFRKLEEKGIFSEKEINNLIESELSLDELSEQELADFWSLVFYASTFEEEVLNSINSLEFSHLAKFAFNLSQKFNSYYHSYQILKEENKNLKKIRILTVYYVKEILRKALNLMGIPQPEIM
ncbi:arginine--tRNA ligase, partial [Candidatus Aminicenantes bacterium AC-335-G13]|nr:arginine--tRNA ligase [Candidatus Aminicenantes bacterium AC-335-G13]